MLIGVDARWIKSELYDNIIVKEVVFLRDDQRLSKRRDSVISKGVSRPMLPSEQPDDL